MLCSWSSSGRSVHSQKAGHLRSLTLKEEKSEDLRLHEGINSPERKCTSWVGRVIKFRQQKLWVKVEATKWNKWSVKLFLIYPIFRFVAVSDAIVHVFMIWAASCYKTYFQLKLCSHGDRLFVLRFSDMCFDARATALIRRSRICLCCSQN